MIRLNPVLALCKKELRSWIFSPLFYGMAIFFTLFLSVWLYFFEAFFAMNNAGLAPFFRAFPLVYLPVIPGITMKSWAEEKKSGTAELLFTLPVSELELCTGKFLSSFIVLLIYILLSLPVPLTLLPLGKFDTGIIITGYSGTILLGAFALSLGQFCSGLSGNQPASYISAAAMLLILFFPDRFAMTLNFNPLATEFLNYLSLSFHFESFSRGLLDSRDLIFFAVGTVFFIFLNSKILVYGKQKI